MPTGKKLGDGFSTKIAFAGAATIALWEQRIKPPGGDAGGANDTTTMRNTRFRTRQPKKLITMTDSTGTAAYDPKVYTDIFAQLGVNQTLTITFPDLSTLVFWGWLDKCDPQEIREGDMPLLNFTVVPSNQDNTGAEVAPVYNVPPP